MISRKREGLNGGGTSIKKDMNGQSLFSNNYKD
jgi:hypothetical protein